MTTGQQTDICMIVHNDVATDARVLKEAASLAARGWKVVVVGISLSGPARPSPEFTSGFTIIRVTPSALRDRAPRTWGKLLRLIASLPTVARALHRADARIYHAHDFIGLLILALAGLWRRPVVYDSHELFFDRFPPEVRYRLKYALFLMRPLEKLLARRAVMILTPNEEFADILEQTLGVPRPVVVSSVVDLRILEPGLPIPRKPGQIVIGHSGYLIQGRHLRELILALKHLPENFTLALIGDGVLREELLALACDNGVGERVTVIRPVTPRTMPTTLAQADVAAVLITSSRLSYDRAVPNKVFEALAAGIPIVAGNTTALKTWITAYQTGVNCDPTRPEAIAAAVLDVLEPEKRARFTANIAVARAELNWEAQEGRLLDAYARLLDDQTD